MDKLKEFLSFCVCVAIILGIARFTGFLEGFSQNDFIKSYNKILAYTNISKNSSAAKYLKSDTQGKFMKSDKYNNYRTIMTPKKILDTADSTGDFRSLFFNAKKTVFYVYDHENKDQTYTYDFHNNLQKYVESHKLYENYNFEMITYNRLKYYSIGGAGADSICNSIKECNEIRQNAVNHSLLAEFVAHCGRTMCIMNTDTNQYVMLKKRNLDEAIKLLEAFKNW